jgi:hypothetical protein
LPKFFLGRGGQNRRIEKGLQNARASCFFIKQGVNIFGIKTKAMNEEMTLQLQIIDTSLQLLVCGIFIDTDE